MSKIENTMKKNKRINWERSLNQDMEIRKKMKISKKSKTIVKNSSKSQRNQKIKTQSIGHTKLEHGDMK